MSLKRTTCLLLLIFAFLAGAVAQPTAPASLSLLQYKAELDRLIGATEGQLTAEQAHELNLTVPLKWHVASEQTFVIDCVWIKLQLGNIKSGKAELPKEVLSALNARLREMRSAADAFDNHPVDSTRQKAALTAILARKEFSNVRTPNWFDRMKARAVQWLYEQLGRLFGSEAAPTVGRVLVWTIIAAAVIVLALMIYRVLKNNARMESAIPKIVPVSAKPWSEWMNEARAAAAQGDWREAIHLSYWAGVSLLEARGLWKPDRARTPREYLRLLALNSEYHPTLTQLTRRFETIWYGYKSADESVFTQALSDLEKLGCR